jgi:hypothetical protein
MQTNLCKQQTHTIEAKKKKKNQKEKLPFLKSKDY